MTFLELCQSLAQEAGVNGTGPTSVSGQTGELKRVVDWIKQSWQDIQRPRKWNWLWERASLTMLAGNSTLAGTIPARRYEIESLYVPATGQMGRFPNYVAWDDFRLIHPFVQAGPTFNVWTIAPDGSLRVDVQVSANVPFEVERYKLPTNLSADTDEPAMPSDLHMIIVWNALIKYADYDEAGTQRATAVERYNELEKDLLDRCLQPIQLGGPLGGL